MKHIEKGKEPKSLTTYKKTPNVSYTGCPCKSDIRLQLIIEQGAICAYCMKRISMDRDRAISKPKTEIEHYLSQASEEGEAHDLEFKNMLGVCNGNQKSSDIETIDDDYLHCDKSKDSDNNRPLLPLTINPLNKVSVAKIKYLKDGEIYSDDAVIDRDLKTILNLNEPTLKKNRGAAILFAFQEIKEKHPSKHKGLWRLNVVESVFEEWSIGYKSKYEDTEFYKFKEYCEAVKFHLSKLIRRIKTQAK